MPQDKQLSLTLAELLEYNDTLVRRLARGILNKLQGELDASGQNCIYNHDHAAHPELCEWHS